MIKVIFDLIDLFLWNKEVPQCLFINFRVDFPGECKGERRGHTGVALDNIGVIQNRSEFVFIDVSVGRDDPALKNIDFIIPDGKFDIAGESRRAAFLDQDAQIV